MKLRDQKASDLNNSDDVVSLDIHSFGYFRVKV